VVIDLGKTALKLGNQEPESMSTLKNIIVIGGSGNVGKEVLSALLARKHEFGTISALKREGYPTSDVLKELSTQGVQLLEANFKDKDSLVHAMKGADVVVSTVNVPAFNDQYLFLDAAIEAKVKRFIPSEFGSNTNLPDVASIQYLQPKIKFAHYVEEKAKEGLIDYTIINTGGFPEYAIKTGFYGINFKDRTFHAIGDGKKPNTFTSLPDVGKYVAAILSRPDLTRNHEIFVSSFTSDYISFIDLLEKETGDKFTVYEETPAEQVARGDPEYLVQMRSMLLDGRGVNNRGGYELWDDKFPEVKPRTLEEVVRQSIKDLEA